MSRSVGIHGSVCFARLDGRDVLKCLGGFLKHHSIRVLIAITDISESYGGTV